MMKLKYWVMEGEAKKMIINSIEEGKERVGVLKNGKILDLSEKVDKLAPNSRKLFSIVHPKDIYQEIFDNDGYVHTHLHPEDKYASSNDLEFFSRFPENKDYLFAIISPKHVVIYNRDRKILKEKEIKIQLNGRQKRKLRCWKCWIEMHMEYGLAEAVLLRKKYSEDKFRKLVLKDPFGKNVTELIEKIEMECIDYLD